MFVIEGRNSVQEVNHRNKNKIIVIDDQQNFQQGNEAFKQFRQSLRKKLSDRVKQGRSADQQTPDLIEINHQSFRQGLQERFDPSSPSSQYYRLFQKLIRSPDKDKLSSPKKKDHKVLIKKVAPMIAPGMRPKRDSCLSAASYRYDNPRSSSILEQLSRLVDTVEIPQGNQIEVPVRPMVKGTSVSGFKKMKKIGLLSRIVKQ